MSAVIAILVTIILAIIFRTIVKPQIDLLLVELQECPVEATKKLVCILIIFVILCIILFLVEKYKK